jgi:hypothetical protein
MARSTEPTWNVNDPPYCTACIEYITFVRHVKDTSLVSLPCVRAGYARPSPTNRAHILYSFCYLELSRAKNFQPTHY